MSMIKFFLEKQFKKINACASVGSGHPFISQSDTQAYIERKEKQSTNSTSEEDLGTGPNLNAMTTALHQWTIVDDEKIIRGP